MSGLANINSLQTSIITIWPLTRVIRRNRNQLWKDIASANSVSFFLLDVNLRHYFFFNIFLDFLIFFFNKLYVIFLVLYPSIESQLLAYKFFYPLWKVVIIIIILHHSCWDIFKAGQKKINLYFALQNIIVILVHIYLWTVKTCTIDLCRSKMCWQSRRILCIQLINTWLPKIYKLREWVYDRVELSTRFPESLTVFW